MYEKKMFWGTEIYYDFNNLTKTALLQQSFPTQIQQLKRWLLF
jgi:hypothetical protein